MKTIILILEWARQSFFYFRENSILEVILS